MTRYLIGIDLGTTNSAVAYVDLQSQGPALTRPAEAPKIEHFQILQLVKQAQTAPRDLLPSFLYLPGPHDLPAGATALPWDPPHAREEDVVTSQGCPYTVGDFARTHGARVPGRLVTSAKSWLCHAGVDRSAPLLPWSAPPDVPRISPVEAATRFLRHMTQAWNFVMAAKDPANRLERQNVVLTVPASFDDMVRTLTVEAARQASIENLTLLEEPQAAFYCWLAAHSAKEAARIRPGDCCLVVDVGGGTTDFSLIQAVEQAGELGFVRQAVGDHLLLGGDNMDLALAKIVEAKLPAAGRLDATQYGMLTQACRQAKEALLREGAPASFAITVMGRGRQVIGGSLNTTLGPEDVRKAVVEGFFPLAPYDAEPQRGPRVGLHEMGLPYALDPAITRHLASFLRKHGRRADGSSSQQVRPASILFNGGVFQPAPLRDRVVEVMRHWFDRPGEPWQPLVLTNPSLDLAVAYGAAYFAWLKHTGGRRIGGGIARSYYVGIQSDAATNLANTTVLCLVPRHLEEGHEITLTQPELELALGQPVMFPLYTSTVRGDDNAGDLLRVAPTQLRQLPSLHTVLRGGKRSGTRSVPVTLAARCTEIGTLELACVAKGGDNRWRLEFNVRDIIQDQAEDGTQDGLAGVLTDIWPEDQVQEAARLIRATYSSPSHGDPKQLTKALEAALEAGREKWPTGLCRRLWDYLSEAAKERRASPARLSRWYNLVGFCLRPGFGDPLDKFRVEQLWKLLHAPRSQAANRSGGSEGEGGVKMPARALAPPEGGADFWIMWRRVAGGLNVQLQNTLFNRLRPVLLPGKGKNVARPGPNEVTEMWRAAAALERLDVKQKELLGQTVLKSSRRGPVPAHAFWALTRIGARVLLYGPLNSIVHPELVQTWLEGILPFVPANHSERLAWAFCLTQLARRSGQRALDVDEGHRDSVLTVLRGQSVPAHWLRMVEEVVELETDEQSQMFGEGLPIGLRLTHNAGLLSR